MDIKEQIKKLPHSPGVYIMKDASGNVLYVGKAIDLKKRVSSYFISPGRHPDRIRMLVSLVSGISFIPTGTEAEALIYENGLIKKLSPKYNVALKDGKTYPLLKLTINEKYPRLFITREKKDDGAIYYGPYTNVALLRSALSMMKRLFPLRTCVKMKGKALCLNYHIKQCVGPCAGFVKEAEYNEIIEQLKLFLEGKKADLLSFLSGKMRDAAAREDYEEAASIRDRMVAISSLKEDRVRYGIRGDLEELRAILNLSGAPNTIEAFDVSNIMGEEAVGSMVSFFKGRPNKDNYRRFRIKTVGGIDDYGMIKEIVRRRYTRPPTGEVNKPDLILIDGGLGHLNAACEELSLSGLDDVPVISIAKKFEHVYSKNKSDPIILPKESKALLLLQRIRDEAHRFAISYHKMLRTKKIRHNSLDHISGIGRTRKKALLAHFGSVENILKADEDELKKVKGMNDAAAKNIKEYFEK